MQKYKLRYIIPKRHKKHVGNKNRLVQDVAYTILDTIEEITMPAMLNNSFKEILFKNNSKKNMSKFDKAVEKEISENNEPLTGGKIKLNEARSVYHNAIRYACQQECTSFFKSGYEGSLGGKAGTFFTMFRDQTRAEKERKKAVSLEAGARGSSIEEAILQSTLHPPTDMEVEAERGIQKLKKKTNTNEFRHSSAIMPTLTPSEDKKKINSMKLLEKQIDVDQKTIDDQKKLIKAKEIELQHIKTKLTKELESTKKQVQDQQNQHLSDIQKQYQDLERAQAEKLQKTVSEKELQYQNKLQAEQQQKEKDLYAIQQKYEAQLELERKQKQKLQQSVTKQVQQQTAQTRDLLRQTVSELKQSQKQANLEKQRFSEELENAKEKIDSFASQVATSTSELFQQNVKMRFGSAFMKIYENAQVDKNIADKVVRRPTFVQIINGGPSVFGKWLADTFLIAFSIFKHLGLDYEVWMQQIPNAKAVAKMVHTLYNQVWVVVKELFTDITKPNKSKKRRQLQRNTIRRENQMNYGMTPELVRKVRLRGKHLNDRMARTLKGGNVTSSMEGGMWGAKSVVNKALQMISSGMMNMLGKVGDLIKYFANVIMKAFPANMQFKSIMNFFTPEKQIQNEPKKSSNKGPTNPIHGGDDSDETKQVKEEEKAAKSVENYKELSKNDIQERIRQLFALEGNKSDSILCTNVQEVLYNNMLTRFISNNLREFNFPLTLTNFSQIAIWGIRFVLELIYISVMASLTPFLDGVQGFMYMFCLFISVVQNFFSGKINTADFIKLFFEELNNLLKLEKEEEITNLLEDLKKDYNMALTTGEMVYIVRRRLSFIEKQNQNVDSNDNSSNNNNDDDNNNNNR